MALQVQGCTDSGRRATEIGAADITRLPMAASSYADATDGTHWTEEMAARLPGAAAPWSDRRCDQRPITEKLEMADAKPIVHIGENSPEEVALKLLHLLISPDGRARTWWTSLRPVTTAGSLRSSIQALGLPHAPDAVLPQARFGGRSPPHSRWVRGFALVGLARCNDGL